MTKTNEANFDTILGGSPAINKIQFMAETDECNVSTYNGKRSDISLLPEPTEVNPTHFEVPAATPATAVHHLYSRPFSLVADEYSPRNGVELDGSSSVTPNLRNGLNVSAKSTNFNDTGATQQPGFLTAAMGSNLVSDRHAANLRMNSPAFYPGSIPAWSPSLGFTPAPYSTAYSASEAANDADSMRELENLLQTLTPFRKESLGPPSTSSPPVNDGPRPPWNQKAGVQGRGSRGGSSSSTTTASTAVSGNNAGRGGHIVPEESVKRTVYVSDIDQQVTEEQLAALFLTCGQVIDCRICGDPNSVLRFAFVEFNNEEEAKRALALAGTVLGYYPLSVLPSKTAIVPVNPTYLPRTESERDLCARTVYCANIDKKVTQSDVRLFFESLCGEVSKIRLLGDHHHHSRIAFVEFVEASSAMAALNCSGAVLGSLPIRVSPSKTPVRPRVTRQTSGRGGAAPVQASRSTVNG